MFGESDSESPRAGSPWDPLISSSPSTEPEAQRRHGQSLPKLVPEAEYGNVEYKLKLLNPSPERFTRLVTQMKWRLLEGGGQAYYELGVADSGQLVGLSRRDLEQSLETLEMMAGEIGASVAVVKEIEVPATLLGSRTSLTRGIPQHGPDPSISECEVEGSTTTKAETNDDQLSMAIDFDAPSTSAYQRTHTARSHPERPGFQSSPAILPPQNFATTSANPELDANAVFHLDFEIEIASVYKPRPLPPCPFTTLQPKHNRRSAVSKVQTQQPLHLTAKSKSTAKEERRLKRDGRHKTLATDNIIARSPEASGDAATRRKEDPFDSTPVHRKLHSSDLMQLSVSSEMHDAKPEGNSSVGVAVEPKLIVEALVVRKLTLEEAFLDFGGFFLEM